MNINHDRKGVIDALRGYFIIWIGLYNTFAVFNTIRPNLVLSSILLFVNDKGWFCLSTIFGYGFGVLIKKGNHSGFAFQQRMLLLFGIGIFNNLFFYGDILKEYAIIGLILFYTKNISSKFPIIYLLFIFIFTLLALYIVPFDMQQAGDLESYFADNNPLFANLKYCYHLNTQSLYFGICYHLEMLFLASMGYFMAFYQLESVIVRQRKKLFYEAFFSMLTCLLLIFFIVQKDNPLIKIIFFFYILSLSVWFVLGFYGFTKKYQSFSSLLSNFGQKSLTIYLVQNFLICTIWLWSETPEFRIYCLGQILILLLSQWYTKNGIGIVEYYWRQWSQTTRKIGI